jgi:hypothetical protein
MAARQALRLTWRCNEIFFRYISKNEIIFQRCGKMQDENAPAGKAQKLL